MTASDARTRRTGEGETTKDIAPYKSVGFTMWDMPGRHDGLSYFTLEYISMMKGLTKRVVLVRNTVKEMTKVCELLDALNLHYIIVVNRFQVQRKSLETQEERVKFEEQIKQEVKNEKLTYAGERVFFIAATATEKYAEDWQDLYKLLLE